MAEQIYVGLVIQLVTIHGPQEIDADWYTQRTQAAFLAAQVFAKLREKK